MLYAVLVFLILFVVCVAYAWTLCQAAAKFVGPPQTITEAKRKAWK